MNHPKPPNVLVAARFGKMLVNHYDQYIGAAFQQYGDYSWAEIELINQLVSLGDTVVEVGANIGAHSIPISQRLGQQGCLVVFEPQRLVYQMLCANLALNNCFNVQAKWAAAGGKTGAITVPDLPPDVPNNFGGIELGTGQGMHVPLMMIDDLQLESCHLIKADVEGMELDVLQGAGDTLKRHQPYLYLEADRKPQLPDLLTYLFALEYRVFWHLPPIFSPDNLYGKTDDVFNVISINLVCLPRHSNRQVTGLTPVESIHDWPMP